MSTTEALYSNKIFLNAALPLVKVIATDVPSLNKLFVNAHAVIQVSCKSELAPEGKFGTHFVVNSGEWLVHPGLTEKPHIELEFKSVEALNAFFKGSMAPNILPKFKGMHKKPAVFAAFMMVLIKMSTLLGSDRQVKKSARSDMRAFVQDLADKANHAAVKGKWILSLR